MQNNQPVTQREHDYPSDMMLVSSTNTQGHITHCNRAFVEISGFSYDELIGQPHNIVRHPDMPPEAYRDMWRTIGHGQPWTALVKNRRKNGDHYWVRANVTPIMENGKPTGYMSVRTKPSRQEIQQAEALYARLNQNDSGLSLRQGRVVRQGPMGWWDRWQQSRGDTRLTVLLLTMILACVAPVWLDVGTTLTQSLQLAGLLLGSAWVLAWFRHSVTSPLAQANQFARDVAACNLTTQVPPHTTEPAASLLRSLAQIQVNLRAVIGDVRNEVEGFSTAATEIASASLDLSERTESQASNLQQTAASMEQITANVQHTSDHTHAMAAQSAHGTQVALDGQKAIDAVGSAMHGIETSSKRMNDIIGVIEGIAFQTNLLALNAAVEAARAGDQGRGFAVVADEVRGLAQRSSTAAKEIRSLIQTSVRQVSTGVEEMSRANATMQDVTQEVKSIGVLVDEIRHATEEEADGLHQINTAIIQLDNVTQQNAAMVEETSAAAAGLRQGAQSLLRSVGVFKL